MNLDEFNTDTYARRPFEVQAFEITQNNIAELAPHVGELCDDNGAPYIKSDKKKVGNNFKVWPGFFATVLKGNVRCYSRKSFFEQFGELNDKTSPVVEFLHNRCTLEEMLDVLNPTNVVGEPDVEEAPEVEVEVNIDLSAFESVGETGSFPEEPVPTCVHGTPGNRECPYWPCFGVETGEEGEVDNDPEPVEARDTSKDARDLSEWMGTDEEVAARHGDADLGDTPNSEAELGALERYRTGLESVIGS